MQVNEKLIPGGILEPLSGRAFLFFTDTYKTSDFIVDVLEDNLNMLIKDSLLLAEELLRK